MVMDLAGMTGEQQAQALIAQGWTWEQVRASYPQLFGAGTAGVTIGASAIPAGMGGYGMQDATGPVPGPTLPIYDKYTAGKRAYTPGAEVLPGEQGLLGDIFGGIAGAGVPAVGGIAALLGAIGIPTGILAAGYGLSQMAGVQYPWETGPGEGFIAPWSRDIAQDEQGRWVTRETRPDLFVNGGNGGPLVPFAGGAMVGVGIAKQWSANGWPFVMTTDGYIHTVTKSGLRKRWKPYKSVVLGKNPSPKMLNRAVTKLVQFDNLHTRIQKMARRIKT